MKHYYFLSPSDPGKDSQLQKFANKFPTYGPGLGYTPLQIGSAVADALWLHFIFQLLSWYSDAKKSVTEIKNIFRDGPVDATITMFPDPTTMPVAPATAVAPGIIHRFTDLAAEIKNKLVYTPAMGKDMGLEGSENVIDLLNTKPDLKVVLFGGKPVITFIMGSAAGAADIYVERTPGAGFTFLVRVISPEFTDNFVLPPGVTSALWSYKAMFVVLNEHIGQMSKPASIMVEPMPGWLPSNDPQGTETIINMDGVLKFGAFVFPQLPPGTATPPPTSLLDISCEDENALIDGWFCKDGDNSGFPLPTSQVLKIKKGQPFSGIGSSAGYKDDTTKLVLRNNGTMDGHWYIKITVK